MRDNQAQIILEYQEKCHNDNVQMQKVLATNCDLSELNKVLEHETSAKSKQIDQLQDMLKANQSENGKHKYRIGSN